MRYLVLSWDSLDLKQYRKREWFGDEQADAAWARVAELWRNPRTRLALVVAVPDKPKKSLTDLIREDAEMPQRFTIPRWLTGNEKPVEDTEVVPGTWSV